MNNEITLHDLFTDIDMMDQLLNSSAMSSSPQLVESPLAASIQQNPEFHTIGFGSQFQPIPFPFQSTSDTVLLSDSDSSWSTVSAGAATTSSLSASSSSSTSSSPNKKRKETSDTIPIETRPAHAMKKSRHPGQIATMSSDDDERPQAKPTAFAFEPECGCIVVPDPAPTRNAAIAAMFKNNDLAFKSAVAKLVGFNPNVPIKENAKSQMRKLIDRIFQLHDLRCADDGTNTFFNMTQRFFVPVPEFYECLGDRTKMDAFANGKHHLTCLYCSTLFSLRSNAGGYVGHVKNRAHEHKAGSMHSAALAVLEANLVQIK
jgi:hypothetical protein